MIEQHSVQKSSTDHSALDRAVRFLHSCSNATYDWTSSIPILPPPEGVRKAIAESYSNFSPHKVTPSQGEPIFLEAARDYFRRCDIPCTEESIMVVNTSFDVISDVYRIFYPGKTVLIPTPAFGYYLQQCHNNGMKIATLPAEEKDGWKILPEALDQALTDSKASIFIFNNPVNPTGVAYTKEEVEALAVVLKKHDVLVITDEVFKDIRLSPQHEPYSIAAVPDMLERTITLNGVGKSRGLAELHISFACIPKRFMPRLLEENLTGFARPNQIAAAQSLQNNNENNHYLRENERLYLQNIALVNEKLDVMNAYLREQFKEKNPKKIYVKPLLSPQTTNLYLLDFSGLKGAIYNRKQLTTGLDVAEFLLQAAGVAVVPGEGFLMKPDAMVVRLCVGYPKEELAKGFDAITKGCSKLVESPSHYPHRSSSFILSKL